MSRIAYVNGRYLPQGEASVNVEDRGYQFADGVYEVLYLTGGRFLDEALHMARLERSLREIDIAPPMGRAALMPVLREVIRPQPAAGRAGLHAGDARRRAAGPRVPVPAGAARAGGDLPPHAALPDGPGRLVRRGDHRGRTSAGRGATSSRRPCCPTCSPNRQPGRPAPWRPSWSTATAW